MHEPGRIYKVFIYNTDEFLFETDDLHHIIKTGQEKNERLLCISTKHVWDIYPGGRNILTERKTLTPGLKELTDSLFQKHGGKP